MREFAPCTQQDACPKTVVAGKSCGNDFNDIRIVCGKELFLSKLKLLVGTHPLGEREAFPQVNGIIPHAGNLYSPYRRKVVCNRLELTPAASRDKTAGQGHYSPYNEKYSP